MKILSFFIIFLGAHQLFAQENQTYPYKRFGFVAGINTANMNFNKGVPAPPANIPATWKTGLTLGFLARIPLTDHIFLQPEYLYSQRNGGDKSLNKDYSIEYFSLPLLLSYKISPRFSVMAGPQAELLIGAKADSNGVKRSITHDVEERSIGIAAGAQIQLVKSLFLSLRYFQGLNHIGIGQRTDVKEFKYEVANLSIGIEF